MSNLLVQNIKHTNGTTAQTVDSSGRVTTPARPMFRAYNTTSGWVELTHDSNQILNFNATQINNGNHYNTSTYKFTAPVAGLYEFRVQIYTHSAGGGRYLYFYKNDAQASQHIITNQTGDNRGGDHVDVFELSASDTVSSYMYHGADTQYSYYAGNGNATGAWSSFSGHLVG